MLDWARRIYVQLAYPLAEGLQGLIRQAGRQAGVAQKELRRFTHGGVGRGGAVGIASHETRNRMEEPLTSLTLSLCWITLSAASSKPSVTFPSGLEPPCSVPPICPAEHFRLPPSRPPLSIY